MMEICVNSVRHALGKIKKFSGSPTGIFLYSLTTAAVGIVILLGFFSTLLSTATVAMLLPVMVGFNCAAAGYGYAEKRWSDFPLQRLPLLLIAVLLASTGCAGMILFNPWQPFADWWRYGLSFASALFFTFSGAWIAIKNKKLTQSS
jgi:hypothetical protein